MSYGYYWDGYIVELDSHDECMKEAESILDDLRCDAADGWSDEVGRLCVVLETYHTVMINERQRTDEDVLVDPNCETICDYELQPTAEWTRIQDRLKAGEAAEAALENANRIITEIWDMFYGQNMEIANWHQNGDLEPIDKFFESNDWLLEPLGKDGE